MQRPGFLGEEDKSDQRSRIFKKLLFSLLLIFSDEIIYQN